MENDTNSNQPQATNTQPVTPPTTVSPAPELATANQAAQPETVQTPPVTPQAATAPAQTAAPAPAPAAVVQTAQPIAAQMLQPTAQPMQIQGGNKKSKKLMFILLGVVGLVLLIGGFFGYQYRQLSQLKKAGYSKVDETIDIFKNSDIDNSEADKEKFEKILFEDLGYNRYETDTTKLREMFEVTLVMVLVHDASKQGGTIEQTDMYFGKDKEGNLLATKEYEIHWSKAGQTITIKLGVNKDKKDKWKVESLSSNPTVTSILTSQGKKLPVSENAIQFDSSLLESPASEENN